MFPTVKRTRFPISRAERSHCALECGEERQSRPLREEYLVGQRYLCGRMKGERDYCRSDSVL